MRLPAFGKLRSVIRGSIEPLGAFNRSSKAFAWRQLPYKERSYPLTDSGILGERIRNARSRRGCVEVWRKSPNCVGQRGTLVDGGHGAEEVWLEPAALPIRESTACYLLPPTRYPRKLDSYGEYMQRGTVRLVSLRRHCRARHCGAEVGNLMHSLSRLIQDPRLEHGEEMHWWRGLLSLLYPWFFIG